mmetsp:Transcript_78340/g.135861  ORF Transcript_78340/g.135861 Transcript_78340/m.135861 type:complete len:293 (+) Transcript_78340:1-879(+)
MRNHYEGTWFDPSRDIGAGQWHLPYRLGSPGLTWTYNGKRYTNERNVGVEKAAINIVANQRKDQRFGVLWFGVDDSTFSLHTPIYGVTTQLPASWDGGNCTGRAACREAFGLPGTITKFSTQAMHWVGQLVANLAYSRYDVIAPVVQQKLAELESQLFDEVRRMDAKILLLDIGEREVASDFSYQTAERLHATWLEFWGQLFATHVDGYRTVPNPKNSLGRCDKESPAWEDAWKKRIVEETGDRYLIPAHVDTRTPPGVIDKLSLVALGGSVSIENVPTGDPEGNIPSELVV